MLHYSKSLTQMNPWRLESTCQLRVDLSMLTMLVLVASAMVVHCESQNQFWGLLAWDENICLNCIFTMKKLVKGPMKFPALSQLL